MPIIAAFIVPHPPLIVPEVGKGDEKKIKDTIDAYNDISKEIAKIKPDTIIISSPHSEAYADYFHISPSVSAEGDFARFGAPEVKFEVEYDQGLVSSISNEALRQNISAGTEGESTSSLDHGTTVPLYFINKYYDKYKLVRLGLSGLQRVEHYKLGKLIQSVIPDNKKVVWVASGDLSHNLHKSGLFGYGKEGKRFDKEITEALGKGDFLELLKFDQNFVHKAGECGLNSFIMMAGALDGFDVKSKLLSYEGTYGVGYAVASFKGLEKDSSRMFDKIFEEHSIDIIKSLRLKEDPYVKLARDSLEYYLTYKKYMKKPKDLIDELNNKRAAVFVSLYKNDQLRGCIGTIEPRAKCIAEEIIENAVSAGIHDNRFRPVKIKEIPYLQYKVDVLMPKENIESMKELDVIKYGVIVSNRSKRGLLLPNIEGVDTVEQQVRIAKSKAGIKENESFTMERFEVIRHF